MFWMVKMFTRFLSTYPFLHFLPRCMCTLCRKSDPLLVELQNVVVHIISHHTIIYIYKDTKPNYFTPCREGRGELGVF